jgi:hypothetical protein
MRGQIHSLELVYPPISNQEAEWVKDDPVVQEWVANSNLYFIGQKPETFYEFDEDVVERIKREAKIHFDYVCGAKRDKGYIDISSLLKIRKLPDNSEMEIELGKKMIRIWLSEDGQKLDVIEWLTTDKVLFDKSRRKSHIIGLDKYRDFAFYYLHYVGISKRENSLQRLVVKPHDKRLRILSNENPMNMGSRVTDEIVLFFFRIASMEIKQYLEDSDFDGFGKDELGEDSLRIIADAEKAFVSIMDTNYNEVKYKDYPYSTDGLYKSTVDRISFSINEDVKFITDTTLIKGVRNSHGNLDESDFIFVTKDAVELVKMDEIADNGNL